MKLRINFLLEMTIQNHNIKEEFNDLSGVDLLPFIDKNSNKNSLKHPNLESKKTKVSFFNAKFLEKIKLDYFYSSIICVILLFLVIFFN